MKRFLLLVLICIFLFSCKDKSNSGSVSGIITNLESGSILFLDYLTPTEVITVDTAVVDDNGLFNFKSTINKSGYYRLKIDNQTFLNLVFEEGDTPIINGDGSNLMNNYTIESSSESNRLKEFQLAFSENRSFLDSLQRVFQSNPELIAKLQKSKVASTNEMNNRYIRLINEKSGSLVSLAAVQQLDPNKYAEFYKRVDETLMKTLPTNKWVEDFHKKVGSLNILSIGNPAPDFTLNNPEGQPITLSSLKGKVVLIDFWASWCRPCRMENPNVVKAYNNYKDKGFDVLSVSLDGVPQQQTPKQDWVNAIKADGLIWKNHVSDLKGWDSSITPLFGVKSIPFTLLIDAEGNILGQNLRGEELESKLESIFK